jgi:ribosome maturation factor RimP
MDRDDLTGVISDLVTPSLRSLGLELFDVQLSGPGKARTLRVTVDRDGGVDLDTIATASQAITPLLDTEPRLRGSYLLEVTSPGIERPLRRPDHFRRAVGETVSVKYHTDHGPERVRGTIAAVDDDGITLAVDGDERRIAFTDITDARTVFDWGPAPRPGKRDTAGARKKEKTRQ